MWSRGTTVKGGASLRKLCLRAHSSGTFLSICFVRGGGGGGLRAGPSSTPYHVVDSAKSLFLLRCMFNIIDILATVPTLVIIALIHSTQRYYTERGLYYTVVVLAALGVFRVFRLFKFARHYDGFRILFFALKVGVSAVTKKTK